MGPMVLFKVYGIALNMMKDTRELQKITYYCDMQFTGEMNWTRRDDEPTQRLKWILATLELSTVATGSGYKIMTVVQYVLQLILCS